MLRRMWHIELRADLLKETIIRVINIVTVDIVYFLHYRKFYLSLFGSILVNFEFHCVKRCKTLKHYITGKLITLRSVSWKIVRWYGHIDYCSSCSCFGTIVQIKMCNWQWRSGCNWFCLFFDKWQIFKWWKVIFKEHNIIWIFISMKFVQIV